jgi:hypothetical protein
MVRRMMRPAPQKLIPDAAEFRMDRVTDAPIPQQPGGGD